MTYISKLSYQVEELKDLGLSVSEAHRLRQYEQRIANAVENLRRIKMYRTPGTLRSLARIFSFLLSAFYSPSYAGIARKKGSIAVGLVFAILVPLTLTALNNSVQVLEDPFVGCKLLDGIGKPSLSVSTSNLLTLFCDFIIHSN